MGIAPADADDARFACASLRRGGADDADDANCSFSESMRLMLMALGLKCFFGRVGAADADDARIGRASLF